MSLPISTVEYTTAKLLAALGMFMIPWLVLVSTALSLIIGRSDIPHGIIPLTLILVTAPLVGFCVMIAVALVAESELNILGSEFSAIAVTLALTFYLQSRKKDFV
jgi:hypothetical protein